MAKATAWCSCTKCGKQFKMEKICCNRSEANSFEAWAPNHYTECPDCYRDRRTAEREAQKAADNAAASVYTEANQLPALTGSEKQVAWANTIRCKRLTYLDSFGSEDARKPEYYTYRDWLLSHTDARYWIDSRDYDDMSFARICMREFKERNAE